MCSESAKRLVLISRWGGDRYANHGRGGREGGRKGGREEGRKGGREVGREGGREGGR